MVVNSERHRTPESMTPIDFNGFQVNEPRFFEIQKIFPLAPGKKLFPT